MKSILASFLMVALLSQNVYAWEIECPSYNEINIEEFIFASYEDGIILWSEGYKESCSEGVCVILNEGSTPRIFDIRSPLHFIADCLAKNVDFCSPRDYNVPCTYHNSIKNNECSA